MKSRKRQLERLYKKTGQAYTDYLQQYKDALSTARSTYYSHLIHSGSTNPKALFSTDSLPAISTLITEIIDSSLRSGLVPHSLKLAAVTPILKKPGLNPDIMSNFRPISNLPFLSKILKCIVATQLKAHLCSNYLLEPFQYGFRPQYSTETALLKVTNDILLSADSGHLTILILLDLTAAFDTINHTILLSCLESSLGITGTATIHPAASVHLMLIS
ncbi:RNA-directed DNA polymerase from mobile element jockey [Collichthys lucidus]|uniref:RNA-directed DNA polymerase from mobile element jockey n=1 Tax=Collichthys lucidus TaxID=240159 RepID=A0A4U5TWS5_COLLU|nr:RNA-directed DNA polymerase from mobile element jockey [Collichthys lucidus]